MELQSLRLVEPHRDAPALPRHRPLGRMLVERGAITPDQLVRALHLQMRLGAPLGEILMAEGWADRDIILDTLATQHAIERADLINTPPDPALSARLPHDIWLTHRVVPWRRVGDTILVATARPDRFAEVATHLHDRFATVTPVLAPEEQIMAVLAQQYAEPLARGAGNRVPLEFSCRSWQSAPPLVLPMLLLVCLVALLAAPVVAFGVLSLVAIVTLSMFAVLRLTAFASSVANNRLLTAPQAPFAPGEQDRRLPKVSVLVPLFREKEIANALVTRLGRLTYPKALLDVILVLEEHDTLTRDTLAATQLPPWMRVIEVPAHGDLTTKPRAMNYALDFCAGEIIGVWDAEDAPAPDQIERVVERFAHVDKDVVCLQGILDYYNPRSNWIARCFTIEYSSWFRVILPGIAKLGLVVPLGGTTLFFKRDKLDELGGWDAHNVTEDADLGMRLCRAGYRTEMINTVTHEEANCRLWPWVKQRSRWLKGFMVTYLVHMRRPRALLRDLGLWRFLSFQAFFIGTLSQFLLAPVLWSFWLILSGLPHPVQTLVPVPVVLGIGALFVLTEALSMVVGALAVSRPERRFLIPWVLTLPLYFPLGTLAAYKALYELVVKPFYWDKTQHGHHSPADPATP
ncbi:glycosyltransferase family 2 protein [Arenibacterium sp. CAU 1754]